jgi:phage tail tape-measure protein
LKLDTESDEVKEILNKYNASAVTSKGVALSAKAEVNKRRLDVEYSKLDENATIEHNNKAEEGWSTFGKSVGFGAAGGGLAGAATGAMIGGILGPIGALVGGGIGALIGGVAGAAGGAGVGTVAGTIASSM